MTWGLVGRTRPRATIGPGRRRADPLLPCSWFERAGRILLAGDIRILDRYERIIETNAIGVLVESDYHSQRFYPWSAIESIEADT